LTKAPKTYFGLTTLIEERGTVEHTEAKGQEELRSEMTESALLLYFNMFFDKMSNRERRDQTLCSL
jgi:hypothetical protein